MTDRLQHELDVAERKAWDSLGRYKFQMFGYWAAIWVHLNRIGQFRKPNPWAALVKQARDVPGSTVDLISDERALDLARRILDGQFTTEDAAIQIMHYATDAVLQEDDYRMTNGIGS